MRRPKDVAARATRKDSEAIVLQLERPLTAFDCETTTANPQTARIVQIAVIQLRPDGSRTEYSTLVNPECPIPADATAIHGITDDMVKDARTWGQLAPRLITAFRGVDYCGYNIARFDLEVLQRECSRVGVDTTVPEGQAPPRILDPYVIWVKQEPRTLSHAVQKFLGRPMTDAHDALTDVQATVEIAEQMFEHWSDLPRDLDALHAFQFPRNANAVDDAGKVERRDGVLSLTFGKHKGTPLASVPRDYLRWLMGTDLPTDTKRIIKEAV